MLTLHLLRHGEVENPEGVAYGRLEGFPLSDNGREGVARSAQALLESGVRPARIVSSPLLRARQSAEIVAEELDCRAALRIEDDLSERASFRDGLSYRFHAKSYLRRMFDREAWARHESIDRVLRRMHALAETWRAEAAEGDHFVVVSHQLPIACLAMSLRYGLPLARALAFGFPWQKLVPPPETASITRIILPLTTRGKA